MSAAHPRGNCRSLVAELSDYIDGSLTPARVRAIERHLANCPCCDVFADSLRQAMAACQAVGRSRLPRDVERRARQRIAQILEGTRKTR